MPFSIFIAIFAVFLIIAALFFAFFFYFKEKRLRQSLSVREKENQRKIYELAILKELGERIGYSLNIQNIIDIITGSLRQFLEYGVVSYMMLEPEKIIFKADIEKSVSREFVEDIKGRMLRSLSALLDKDLGKMLVEEIISGAILVEDLPDKVNSFFNIPLVIAGKLVGVLTVADTKQGLYQEEEVTILYKIIGQASQAVTKLQELVEAEQRKMNAMMESMADGVLMTDRDYRILIANPASKKAVNIENILNPSIFDFIDHLGGKFDIRGKLEESVKLDKTLTENNVLMGERFFQIIVSPVKSDLASKTNETLGAVVIFHDVTHEKEIEKIKEDFTSMIAHELRSPIDSIKKMTELMRMAKMNKKKREEYLQMIYDGSSGLLGLVNNLLDAAKLEAGKFEVLKRPAKIGEIIEGRINFFKSSAKDAGIRLFFQLDKNLPQEMLCDSYRISQVLNNFLSNAIKFTSNAGSVTVQAFLHKKGESVKEASEKMGYAWDPKENTKQLADFSDSLVVAVIDTGSGITKENINQLFSKFKSFDSMGGRRGTGLGLVIAKGIIDAHGGIIGVESQEGVGSVFYFIIPLN